MKGFMVGTSQSVLLECVRAFSGMDYISIEFIFVGSQGNINPQCVLIFVTDDPKNIHIQT
jgi:hypothetical protein